MNVVIIDYGAGNARSVYFALQRQGVNAIFSKKAEEISRADAIIFPGVGHAVKAKENLINEGLWELIPTLKQPFLGVCLGMQLMGSCTEEGNTEGLNIVPNAVRSFKPTHGKIPHMGWNQVSLNSSGDALFNGISHLDYHYFVHSYYMESGKATTASCDYGLRFTAAIRQHNFFGVQFHPEKSGLVGEQLLANFLAISNTWK